MCDRFTTLTYSFKGLHHVKHINDLGAALGKELGEGRRLVLTGARPVLLGQRGYQGPVSGPHILNGGFW